MSLWGGHSHPNQQNIVKYTDGGLEFGREID